MKCYWCYRIRLLATEQDIIHYVKQPLKGNLNIQCTYKTPPSCISISPASLLKGDKKKKKKRKNSVGCYKLGVINTLIDLNYNVVEGYNIPISRRY